MESIGQFESRSHYVECELDPEEFKIGDAKPANTDETGYITPIV